VAWVARIRRRRGGALSLPIAGVHLTPSALDFARAAGMVSGPTSLDLARTVSSMPSTSNPSHALNLARSASAPRSPLGGLDLSQLTSSSPSALNSLSLQRHELHHRFGPGQQP